MRHRQLTRVVVLINSDDYRADMKGDGEGWVARFFSRVNSKRAVVRANKRIQGKKEERETAPRRHDNDLYLHKCPEEGTAEERTP